MTAQPSSQAEREDVARRAREAAAWALLCQRLNRAPHEAEESDTCSLRSAWKAMLAFSDRAHATPRSMREEVVEAYERAAKMADAAYNEWSAKRDAAKAAKLRKEHGDFESMALAASMIAATIRALIPGASA